MNYSSIFKLVVLQSAVRMYYDISIDVSIIYNLMVPPYAVVMDYDSQSLNIGLYSGIEDPFPSLYY